jgi:hypothetical protein
VLSAAAVSLLSGQELPVRPGQEPPARMGSPTCRLHTGRPWLWPPSSSLPRTTVHCVSLANTPVKRVSHHVLPELSGGSHEAGLHHAYPSRPPERATEHSFTGLAAFPGIAAACTAVWQRWGSRGDLQPIRRMDLDPPAQATTGRLAAPMARLNAWTARVALGLSVNPAREPVHAGCLVIAREARGAGELASGSHKEQENHTNPATGACRTES